MSEGPWICRECGAEFSRPSFSEGPKVFDEATQTVKRFTQALHLCPECLSPNIYQPTHDRPRLVS